MLTPMIYISAITPLLIVGGAFLLPLRWSRRDVLLGTHVSPDFNSGPDAQDIRRKYALSILFLCVAAVVVAVAGIATRHLWLRIAARYFEVAGLLLVWARTWRSLRVHRTSNQAVRTASLTEPEHVSVVWWSSTLAALLPLIATAAFLLYHRHAASAGDAVSIVPGDGPNRGGGSSLESILAPLVVAGFAVVICALMGEITVRYSPGYKGRTAFVRTSNNIVRIAVWFASVLACTVSLFRLVPGTTKIISLVVGAGEVFAFLFIGLLMYRMTRMYAMTHAQYSTDDRFWKVGLFYYNPADEALMVPKRTGLGFTMNFGRPVAWMILGAILFVPLAIKTLVHFGH